MDGEIEVKKDLDLISQIANLKYANSKLKNENDLLTLINDGLKNELRDKKGRIEKLQNKLQTRNSS